MLLSFKIIALYISKDLFPQIKAIARASSGRNPSKFLCLIAAITSSFKAISTLFLGSKEYLIEFHKNFINKYQSVENYLLNVGLTLEEINMIRSKLLGE